MLYSGISFVFMKDVRVKKVVSFFFVVLEIYWGIVICIMVGGSCERLFYEVMIKKLGVLVEILYFRDDIFMR